MRDESVTDIRHSPDHARHSEGAFAGLADGRLLFAYTRYGAGRGMDADSAELVGRFSADGGRTWSAPPRLLVANEGACNVMSVSLLRMRDGRLALFYLRKNGWLDCAPFVRYSRDEGESWGDPVRIVPFLGYFVLNNDRVIQLSSGRIIMALCQHHHAARPDGVPGVFKDRLGTLLVVWSDDDGATWQVGPERWMLPSGRDYLQEPGLVERQDGSLWCFMRTNTGRQWESFSGDRGESWTLPRSSRFESPCSPLSVKRIPSTGHLLAVWNDTATARRLWGPAAPVIQEGWGPAPNWGRTPLVAAISRDEGRRWGRARILEQAPDHGYCYTAIQPVDNAILLAYNCGGGSDSHVLQDLRVRRIPVAWLYGRFAPRRSSVKGS